MKVLLTGGTGYIGSVVAERLAAAGHVVLALARSDASAKLLEAQGHRVLRGDVADAAAVAEHAAQADAAIHTANTQTDANSSVDPVLARAILGAFRGTAKRFVYTSGAWSFSATGEEAATESSPPDPLPITAWRVPVEREVVAAGGIVVRPSIAYGRGARLQGIPGMLVAEARSRGRVRFIGDGRQEWPLVHVDDLADLYVRALQAPAGSMLHGVGHAPTQMRDVALAASYAGGAPGRIEPWPIAEARAAFGPFADALATSQRISSSATRSLTGWTPSAPTIFEEMLLGSYRAAEGPR